MCASKSSNPISNPTLGLPLHRSGDHRGVLLLHGFASTPYEMRFLGNSLADRGFTVSVPTLPGHGTNPRDLAHTSAKEWLRGARLELSKLRKVSDRILVVGQSMGGLLALRLAAESRVDAIACLAVPLWLAPKSQRVAQVLRNIPRFLLHRIPHRPKDGGSDVLDEAVKAENPAYSVLPVAGVAELATLMRAARAELGKVGCPSLILHGKNDHTAPPECAAALHRELASVDKTLFMLERSYHLVSVDVERDLVAEQVLGFAERILGSQASQTGD